MENDFELQRLLSMWRVSDMENPQFKSNVWRRIARAEAAQAAERSSSLVGVVKQWLATGLQRPWQAGALVAALAVFSVSVADVMAERFQEREYSRLEHRYLVSISPVARVIHMEAASQ